MKNIYFSQTLATRYVRRIGTMKETPWSLQFIKLYTHSKNKRKQTIYPLETRYRQPRTLR